MQEYLRYFKDKVLSVPGTTPLEFTEGPEAFKEAIQFLKTQLKLEPLKWSDELHYATTDHYRDLSSNEVFSHTGSDKSTFKQRIERYCTWGGTIFEAMDFAPRESAVDVVIAWLVDDGNPKRTHR